ncbi:MAG: RsiV family protein [Oscillospiraceae bacterium]|nr:RsiV family protein [Oscillospiraceae bacterium]
MKRKLKAALFALMLIVLALLTACGSAATQSAAETAQQTASPPSESAAATEEPQATEEPAAQEAPQITIATEKRDWYSDDAAYWLMHAEYDDVSVTGEGCEALVSAVSEWNSQQKDIYWTGCGEWSEYAAEEIGYTPMTADSYYYWSWRLIDAERIDGAVLSLLCTDYLYSGGAHGNFFYSGVSFDAQSGEILELSDIISDTDGFLSAAVPYVCGDLYAQYGTGLYDYYEEEVKTLLSEEPTWYLDAEGVTFVFPPYTLGPYAMGTAYSTCPCAEFAEYIDEEYLGLNGAGVARLSAGSEVQLDEGTLCVSIDINEEYGMSPITVSLDGAAEEVGEFGQFGEGYVLRLSDSRAFLLFDADYMSDDYVTFLYEITGGGLVQRSKLTDVCVTDGAVNTLSQTLVASLDVLGSYSADMDYAITADGELEQQGEVFAVRENSYEFFILTAARDLPVTIDGAAATLAAGSRIRITGTDNIGTAYFRDVDTGAEGSIAFERGTGDNSYLLYIGGISEYDCFESLPYVG